MAWERVVVKSIIQILAVLPWPAFLMRIKLSNVFTKFKNKYHKVSTNLTWR